ncbi:hypothetical protein LXL04_016659 [Taraxacum kok-saghyz]
MSGYRRERRRGHKAIALPNTGIFPKKYMLESAIIFVVASSTNKEDTKFKRFWIQSNPRKCSSGEDVQVVDNGDVEMSKFKDGNHMFYYGSLRILQWKRANGFCYGINWLRNQVRSSIATEIKVRSKLIRYGVSIVSFFLVWTSDNDEPSTDKKQTDGLYIYGISVDESGKI